MSGPNHFVQRLAVGNKAPQKSNFVQTCNLLSQYIKEKGNLRDLNLEIEGKVESLESLVKSGLHHHSTSTAPAITEAPKDQPSKAPEFSINTPQDYPSHKTTSKDSKAAGQLTIFYSGKVLVFDDYPADKVKELAVFAKRGSARMSYGILSNTLQGPGEELPPLPQAENQSGGISSNTCKDKTEGVNCGPVATGSELPIARRSSIHRFLEKRKDRAAARGPYHHQVDQDQAASSSKGDDHLQLKL